MLHDEPLQNKGDTTASKVQVHEYLRRNKRTVVNWRMQLSLHAVSSSFTHSAQY